MLVPCSGALVAPFVFAAGDERVAVVVLPATLLAALVGRPGEDNVFEGDDVVVICADTRRAGVAPLAGDLVVVVVDAAEGAFIVPRVFAADDEDTPGCFDSTSSSCSTSKSSSLYPPPSSSLLPMSSECDPPARRVPG